MTERGRNAIIEKLYDQYYDKLVLHCSAMAGFQNELLPLAEECVQEVFHFALKHYNKLQDHPDVKGWLFRCSTNRMNNMLRKHFVRKRRHSYSADEETSPELSDPYDSFRQFEENQAFYECVDRIHELLLENEQGIFDDHFIQGYSIDEVAARVGKSKSSVKSTIYRIRQRLRKSFLTLLIIFILNGASFWIVNN